MSQRRMEMFALHKEKAELAYQESIANGCLRPVVIVADVSDETGRQLAIAAAGEDRVEALERAAGEDFDPCAVFGVDEGLANELLPTFSQNANTFLQLSVPENSFRLAIVSDGVSLTIQPLP